MKIKSIFLAVLASIFLFSCTVFKAQEPKRVVFAYGKSVHMWGDHENKLICEILRDSFNLAVNGDAKAEVFDLSNAENFDALKGASAVVVFAEGEEHHPFKDKIAELKALNESGVSFAFMHYATTPFSKEGGEVLQDLTGGTYETYFSVNPSWQADFKLGDSPILNSVKEFSFYDEIYFNFRFKENAKIIPILLATPPDKVRKYRMGAHSGNKTVRSQMGRQEVIMWACENANGTRGLGSAIGHSIWALNNDNFRKVLLNSAAWLAKIDIPQNGFDSPRPDFEKVKSQITKEKRRDIDSYLKRIDENFLSK